MEVIIGNIPNAGAKKRQDLRERIIRGGGEAFPVPFDGNEFKRTCYFCVKPISDRGVEIVERSGERDSPNESITVYPLHKSCYEGVRRFQYIDGRAVSLS